MTGTDEPVAVLYLGWTDAPSKISRESLAGMIGTARSRVSFFMSRFRRIGYIQYNGRICVHKLLLNVVLHD